MSLGTWQTLLKLPLGEPNKGVGRFSNGGGDRVPVLRIGFVGSECSGKTTVARALAEHLRAWVVPEYFRFYWDAKRSTDSAAKWVDSEFLHMAETQQMFEESYASRADRVLLCDGDASMIDAWSRRYLGRSSPALIALASKCARDLLFWCAPDFPFVDDGVRDGEAIRVAMGDDIRTRLRDAGVTFVELSGPPERRFARARDEIEALLARRP